VADAESQRTSLMYISVVDAESERTSLRVQCYILSCSYNLFSVCQSIAQSLQEQAALSLRRSESRSSLASIGSATSQEVAHINSDSNTTLEQPRSRTGSKLPEFARDST
jgi:hypothetical protein